MGLFDTIEQGLKSSFGQVAEAELAQMLPTALNAANLGGLSGIINSLQQAGLGQQVQSWIANGPNQPITADEIKTVLSNEQLQQLAQHFGVDPNVALNLLAQHLPNAVSQASQNGTLPGQN